MDAFDRGSLQRVARLLAADDDVVVALVFGSAAKGRLRADSDLDIAVLARAPLAAVRKRELIAALAEIAGRPIDLVDLRTAGAIVIREALRHGERLVCKDQRALAELTTRMLLDAADFLPYRERILSERRRKWIH